ncbi:hypothetical protein FQA39_LY14519 [Lamprigera yunnana]|nr:hypothetical protein FQA39_LY14519 [Lamprigera yunnana]
MSLVDVNQAEEMTSRLENLSNLSALEYEGVTVNSNELNRVNVTTCANTSEVSYSSNVIEYSPIESTNSNEQKITESKEMISTVNLTVEEVGDSETVTLSLSKIQKAPYIFRLLGKFDISDREISATPGSKIQVPCMNNADLVENFNYTWTFSDNLQLTAGRVQEYNGLLVIDNVTPQDGVFVTLPYRQVKFTPIVEIENEADIFKTELPKLNIACPPGFGYLHKTRACGACQRNTFNKGTGTKCVPCPVGQYQPLPESKSCLSCSNPLQDPYCLRIVYFNTNRFRILLAVFIAIILMIFVCSIWCQCFKGLQVENVGHKKSFRRRKKNYEYQLPLHDGQKNRIFWRFPKCSKVPPEPPSPDFS